MAADQWNLHAKVSIANMAAKVENDLLENVRKLAQAHDMSTESVQAALLKDLQLSKKRYMGDQNGLLWDEGASRDMPGVCSDKCCCYKTILGNVLSVGGCVNWEWRASWPASPSNQ